MPVSKQTRRSRHEQAENPTLKRGNPSSTEGRVGTQQFRNIPGKGLVHMVRADTGWKELGSSQSSTSKGDKVESITVSAGVSASSGVSSGAAASVHGNLTSLSEDDHSQYVHLSNIRTVSAAHSFTGNPSFSNIDINGGTINGITDLAVVDGGTGQSTLNDLITLGTHTVGNYMSNTTGNDQISVAHTQSEGSSAALSIADDSIGDAQLTYNTGQHLTTATTSVAFAGLDLNGSMTITGGITGDHANANLAITSTNGDTTVEGITFSGNNVVIPGNLTVQGDSVTLTTSTVQVEDKNIYLAYNNTTGNDAAKNTAANAGGVSLKAAEDKHFVWYSATDRWTASEDIEAPGLYLNTNTETKITLHDTANSGTNATIGTSNSGDMILTAVSGQGVTVDNNNHLGGTSFVSGFAGSGWRVTKDSSNEFNAEFDNLIVRGTMSVYELLIQQIRATNGSIMVTSADKVIEIENISGGSSGIYKFTIEADDSDDFIHFKEDDLIIAQKWAGTSGDPPYTPIKRVRATVTETSNSSGSTLTGQEFKVDLYSTDTITDSDLPMDFVRIGNTSDDDRQGGVYITSEDSGAPFIDIFNDVDSWADWRLPAKTKARLGKLDGITHNGTNLTSYGLFSDRVYLTGNITATSGYIGSTSQGWAISSDKISNGNVKLNANNETIQLGTVVDFTNDDNTKSGIFMGLESAGNYDFFVGKETVQYMHWDDSANNGAGLLKVKGSIEVTNTNDFADTNADNTANNETFDSTDAARCIVSANGVEVKNSSGTSLANLSSSLRIGQVGNDKSRLEIDSNGNLAIINRQVSTDTTVINLNSDGNATFTGTVNVVNTNAFAPTNATNNQSDTTTNNAINAKSKIFYQTTAPSSGHSTNDVWYDTDGGYKRYVYNGSSWVDSSDTSYDQSSAISSKNQTFIQTSAPSAVSIGDLWIDTDDNNKLWRASATGSSNWIAATPDPDVNTTTIVGNTITTAYIDAKNVNAATVSSSWVYAGTLTAGQVNAVSINADSIQSGLLRSNRIVAGGANLVPSPAIFTSAVSLEAEGWTKASTRTELRWEDDAFAGSTYRCIEVGGYQDSYGSGNQSGNLASPLIPIDTSQTYRLKLDIAHDTGTDTDFGIQLRFYTSNGVSEVASSNVNADGDEGSPATGILPFYVGSGYITNYSSKWVHIDRVLFPASATQTLMRGGGNLDEQDVASEVGITGSSLYYTNNCKMPINAEYVKIFIINQPESYYQNVRVANISLTAIGEGFGVITGAKIQTSSSGKRIVMDGSNNSMRFYDSSNNQVCRIDDDIFQSGGNDYPGLEITSDRAFFRVSDAGINEGYLQFYNEMRAISIPPASTGSIAHYSSIMRDENVNYPNSSSKVQSFYADARNDGSGSAYGMYIANGLAAKPSGGDWASASDSRVKTVGDNYTTGLSDLIQLEPKYYKYNGKADGAPDDGVNYVGLIAQEAEAVIPSLVSQGKSEIDGVEVDDFRMMDTSELQYAMINAIKELNERLTSLEG